VLERGTAAANMQKPPGKWARHIATWRPIVWDRWPWRSRQCAGPTILRPSTQGSTYQGTERATDSQKW